MTDHDIHKLKSIFATKDDLKLFATKDDLKKFATKKDLEQFAKKDDLKGFATQENLKGFVTRIEFHDAIHELVNLITDGFNRMDQMLESIKDQNDILHNHERGLDKIENKVFV
ncbi:hypothetical protein A2334_05950 [Candidatus Roizmanbacteria bacterium RIFOXYB2_FULL_38_10]|uniref:Uncharacterized protein n=1 Tax=Candidatus Roizmanbacteria bacterium RIFOXYD1_FULL_38_12 TaxID=1802093 RepID=A0A1F7L2H9_9BACT|nr:MAG: hypothetical protein A3K47_03070 [Candidatus Roizmanbacteria bacterium RIFOXYA2_FULL_38_14]OGK64340.1 MAG: hypothetical protein A3K27_03070 [Candidatus Roizmanbacteria bacterium RIFOXYA1_FULL_37_12]OGK66186.1 MAG: hypothetical protein A3K38_03070 [Candidatus Roizmanbacteria bacterium RIFOXYB1_FULL_40_23]OGK68385.1 MAG: hypothetical protein A2334_05950 [Candidatus Roizmanbacteria bacterium RIFOXYB2_FULL_38_10]OGK70591.1 MAG: hypothetical protein A3K21_03075 [Candidatus Roizmanbacteria ba